ncbi:MAG: ParB/RepB/Spo0J family partition protein [Clostridia bacterium]|nr:ParB/RepB/Spo0J family partition protein [Clostridia bacterium]
MSKRGLGKGLGALIPTSVTNNSLDYDPEKDLTELNIKEVVPNVNQPRRNFDPEKLAELTASIKEHGLVQPIVVRPYNGSYQIVAGERRYRACKQLGLKTIPAIIKNLSDEEVTEISLIENIQRQELNPIEEARAYKRLVDEFGLTQEEIAKKVSKSRPFIANFLRLLNLSKEVLDLVEKGDISVGHARALLTLNDPSMQFIVASKIIDENLTVRETEKLTKKMSVMNQNLNIKNKKQERDINPIFNDILDHLQSKFGTKVLIKDKGKGGKIEIEYYSRQDLERIIELIADKEF